jgi:hypothetical protein
LRGDAETEVDPPEEEEYAPAATAVEHGGVKLMTKDSGGEVVPSLGYRRRENKLQKLLKSSPSPRRRRAALLSLAASAG